MNAKPISEDSKSSFGQIGCVIVFGLIFFSAGMAALTFGLLIPWLSALGSSGWQETPCSIVSSEVKRHNGGDSDTFSVEIRYDYEFDQQQYSSDQYDFNSISPGRKRCKEIVSSYPPGQQSVCLVDPDDPASAVLSRDFRMSWLMLVLGSIFSAVGAAVAIGLPLAMGGRKDQKKTVAVPPGTGSDVAQFGESTSQQRGLVRSSGMYTEDVEDQKWDVPQRLKPASTKIVMLLGIIGIAVFWNGIVSVFLLNGIGGQAGGFFSIFLLLFMIPFVLIGLVLIGAVIRSFLTLFNPVFEIAMSTGAIGRGNSVDVAWEIKGNSKSIQRLRIAAVGLESAQYRQGTSTVTANSNFGVIPIVDTTDTNEISFGSQQLTIPADTMHTFGDDNNKVTWAIQVRADIRRWPDVFQKHDFRVKP